jgi:hypothetical protein
LADALTPLVNAGASGTVGGVEIVSSATCYLKIVSGAVLLCSVCSGSLTSSSYTVLSPKILYTILGDKHFAFSFMVKGIPSGFSGITYKDALIWIGFQFIWL